MEYVVLVDQFDNPIGIAEKDTVHSSNTPLHRAFSLFLFTPKGEVIITKRAHTKRAFPDVLTNACCGHPIPDETYESAIKRRVFDELGITKLEQCKKASDYQYRFTDSNGIVENEICPIFIAITREEIRLTKSEASMWKAVKWDQFLHEIEIDINTYSPWSKEEAQILVSIGISRLLRFDSE